MTANHTDLYAAGPDERRWPLQPLQDASGLPDESFSRRLHVSGHALTTAAEQGLTDVQADRWAVRLGWHPMSVWGWDWIDAANDRQPAHSRFAAVLREQIHSGVLRPGEALPPTQQLISRYGISRSTIFKALAELRAEGLLHGGGRGRRPIIAGTHHAERAS
jgi:hypothetical protein